MSCSPCQAVDFPYVLVHDLPLWANFMINFIKYGSCHSNEIYDYILSSCVQGGGAASGFPGH